MCRLCFRQSFSRESVQSSSVYKVSICRGIGGSVIRDVWTNSIDVNVKSASVLLTGRKNVFSANAFKKEKRTCGILAWLCVQTFITQLFLSLTNPVLDCCQGKAWRTVSEVFFCLFFCLLNSDSYCVSQSFTIESQSSRLMCSCCTVRSRPERSQRMCEKGLWAPAVWLIVKSFLLSCLPKKEAPPPCRLADGLRVVKSVLYTLQREFTVGSLRLPLLTRTLSLATLKFPVV